jgi:hypothetical protein
MLEEGGVESLSCIWANHGQPDQVDFGSQVGALERLGFAVRSVERTIELPSLVLTPEGKSAPTR